MSSTALRAGFILLFLGMPGCSKEKFNALVDKTKEKVSAGADQVKQSVTTATDTAKQQLNLAGKAQLQIDSPVETSGCYASFVNAGGGRPSVIQIRSYSSPQQESFPSLFLRAAVQVNGRSELAGQVITAQMFLQREAGSPVWSCSPGKNIEVKIVSVDEKTLSAEIVTGTLSGTHQAGEQPVTGTLSAVWQ